MVILLTAQMLSDYGGGLMLKGIPTAISPELLKVLDEMGHTDEIVIADGNFPSAGMGVPVIRADGLGVPELLDAILQLFPLDTYPNAKGEDDPPCTLMALEPGDVGKVETPIWDEYKEIVARYDERGAGAFQEINKWKFYDQTREKAIAIIQTTETAIYANIIIRKGVVLV